MKLSMIIQATDRATAPIAKVLASTKRMSTGIDQVARSARAASAAEARMFSGTPRRLDAIGQAIGRIVSGPRSLAALERVSYGAGFAIGRVARTLGGLSVNALGYGSAGIGGLFSYLTFGVLKTGAQFELFQAQLESIEGSSAKAKQSLAWVRKFAADTPYEMAEVTEAFVRARKAQIENVPIAMTAIGDSAASNNKSMLDAIEAIADAQTFQYERLREFGITSSTKGNAVSFDYLTKSGKQASKTVSKTALDVQRAVIEIMRATSDGAMKLRSRTLTGIMSNIGDVFTGFQFDIASAGFFDNIKAKLQSLLSWINTAAQNGTLKGWAQSISNSLSDMADRAWKFGKSVDWQQLGSDVKEVGGGIWGLVRGLAAAGNMAVRLSRVASQLPQPPSWVGAAERGVDKFMFTPFSEMFGGKGPAKVAPFGPRMKPTAPRSKEAVDQLWRKAAPNYAPGNAKISLHVTADPGVKVRPTKLSAAGLDVDVNTGRAMRGAA